MSKQKISIVLAILLTLTLSTKAFAAFTLSSNAITGTVASTIDLGTGNALSLQTTNNGNILIGNGNVTIGTSSTLGNAITIIKGGTLGGASALDNFLNVTGTLATNTAVESGANFNITSAGSASFPQRALNLTFNAGYTGSSATVGTSSINSAAGTGANVFGGIANIGITVASLGVTIGNNVGIRSVAQGSSSLNIGGLNNAFASANSPALNIGTGSLALNATVNVGGFFGLMSTAPTLGTSSALIADNGASGSDIFEARNNGTPVFSVTNGGNVNIGSNLTFSPTAPTVASGFGTGASFAAGSTATAFDLNIGTGGSAQNGVITLPAAAHGWKCGVLSDITTNASFVTDQTAYTTTSASFQNYSRTTGLAIAWTASDHLVGGCTAF